ncbi:MAG: ribokinase [Cyanobacteria bacterium P01_C01_bin.120]
MTILVFGSLNMDLVVQLPRLPQPGETLTGSHFASISGGKGANQAVAAARQGVPVMMAGRVGADDFGHQLRHALAVDGVAVDAVLVDADTHTGVAAIAVDAAGENHIVIVPGANGRVGDADVHRLQNQFSWARWLLLQGEIPLSAIAQAASQAQAAGITVIFDPAPVPAGDLTSLYPTVDILTPNQVEAAQLVGAPVTTKEQAAAAIATLQSRGATTVMIKLGAQGVLCGTAGEIFHQPAFAVPVVDTVAAGDAFNGGLVVALHDGKSLREAVTWATATAALSVTQAGAQPSLPTRSQVVDCLNNASV